MQNSFSNLKKMIMPLLLCFCLIYLCIWLTNVLIYVKPEIEFQADNTYDETLTVVAKENFAPYSFVDENGELSGYNIELVNLIANKLEMNVDIQLLPREQCIEKLVYGEADMLCNANYSSEFSDISLLSAPTGRHRFVVYGMEDFRTFHKLYEKKMARVVDSPVESTLHMQLGFNQIAEYNSYEEAFQAVEDGEVDYIIGAYSILNYMTHDTGYTDLEVVGAIINTEAFAFGISKDNAELQQKINNALTELDNTYLYEYISEKWLGSYVDSTTQADIIENSVPWILLVYTIFLIFVNYFVIRPIHKKSQQDKATKLYDKVTTRKMIERKLSGKGTLMVIDINKFKIVNDTYGHAVGDEVIQDVAESLKSIMRNGDIVGRIGGDEFVVYLPNMEFEADALKKAEQFRAEVIERTNKNPNAVPTDISIGIAINTPRGSYDELFVKADKALYEAKLHEEHIATFVEKDTIK